MVVFGAHELSRTLTSATTAAEMDECDGINCGGPIPKVTFESWCTKESAHLRIRRRRWLVLTPMQLATYRSRKGYLRGQLPTERFALLTLGAVIADEDEGSVRLAARERPLVLWFEPGDAAEAPVAASAGVSRADSGAECSCLAAPPPPLSPASPSSATADAADTDQVPPSPAVAAAAGAPSSSGASGAVHASASSSGLNHDVLCPAGPAGASRPLCHQWATRIVNARLASEPSGVVRCAERFELGEVSPCPPPPSRTRRAEGTPQKGGALLIPSSCVCPLQVLGSGAYATVYRATCLTSGRACAVKCVRRPLLAMAMVQQEEAVLRTCQGHPHVVRLVGSFADARHTAYLVMELLPGGDLFEQARAPGRRAGARVLGLYTIFPLSMLYVEWHNRGGRGGPHIAQY